MPPTTPVSSSTTRLIRQGTAGHPVWGIILHCSATRPEWMQNRPFPEQVVEIRRWHVEDNRWRNIGYHHVIGRRGEHASGRPETAIDAHVAGRNNGTIGICLIGGHGSSERERFTDHLQGLAVARPLPAMQRSDEVLREQVSEALKAAPGFVSTGVNATVCGGIVELWGVVRTDDEERAARIAAENVEGVRAVETHLGRMSPYVGAE